MGGFGGLLSPPLRTAGLEGDLRCCFSGVDATGAFRENVPEVNEGGGVVLAGVAFVVFPGLELAACATASTLPTGC